MQRPGNEFLWSGWNDHAEASAEIQGIIDELEAGKDPESARMTVLFAPTGPIQEVSMASGWSAEFMQLANRFDSAIAAFAAVSK